MCASCRMLRSLKMRRTLSCFVNTVKENKKFYTQHQFEWAKQARELFHSSLGAPSVRDFKAIITLNAIMNNPVTTTNIDVTKKIFGPDISALKGITTCRKLAPVIKRLCWNSRRACQSSAIHHYLFWQHESQCASISCCRVEEHLLPNCSVDHESNWQVK